jgi:hypothetical protein
MWSNRYTLTWKIVLSSSLARFAPFDSHLLFAHLHVSQPRSCKLPSGAAAKPGRVLVVALAALEVFLEAA